MASERDDLNVSKIAVAGIVGSLLVIAAILGAELLYNVHMERQIERKVLAAPSRSAEVLADQRAKLEELRPLDREKGIIAIPIERAIELVVKESAASKEPRKSGSQETP